MQGPAVGLSESPVFAAYLVVVALLLTILLLGVGLVSLLNYRHMADRAAAVFKRVMEGWPVRFYGHNLYYRVLGGVDGDSVACRNRRAVDASSSSSLPITWFRKDGGESSGRKLNSSSILLVARRLGHSYVVMMVLRTYGHLIPRPIRRQRGSLASRSSAWSMGPDSVAIRMNGFDGPLWTLSNRLLAPPPELPVVA